MDKKIPARLLIMPPVVSALVIGLGAGLVAHGVRDNTTIWAGGGIMLGFLWGSLVWTERLAKVYERRQFDNQASFPTERIRIELRDTTDGKLSVAWFDFPDGISLEQLIETGKLLQGNGMNFSHAICGTSRPLTRTQYQSLRDIMIARKLARWKSDHSRNQGVELLPPGRRLFIQLATYQEGPLPQLLRMIDKKQENARIQETGDLG